LTVQVHRVAKDHILDPATVVLVGEDVIVGHALELLLRCTDYAAEFVKLDSFVPRRSLGGAQLLLVAPGLTREDRKAVLTSVEADPATKDLPIVELVPAAPTEQLAERHFSVSWPCRTEDLQRQIKAALHTEADGSSPGARTPHALRRGGSI
jgi:hypothetical protein